MFIIRRGHHHSVFFNLSFIIGHRNKRERERERGGIEEEEAESHVRLIRERREGKGSSLDSLSLMSFRRHNKTMGSGGIM